VAVGDRKISGNAQARRWKALLAHGTLVVDFNFDLAGTVPLHPPREPEYRRGRSHRDFLVTLRALGVHASRIEIEKAAIFAAGELYGSTSQRPGPTATRLAANVIPSAPGSQPETFSVQANYGRVFAL
jgi:lipoate-protein ligase A